MGNVYCLKTFRETGQRLVLESVDLKQDFKPLKELYATFNQTVKSIEARYGDIQPRGGVVYQTPVYGMKLDSYGRGNVHNSVFQYKPISNTNWNRPMPFPSDLRKVFKAIHKNRFKNRVMVLGYKSDPFMWMDYRYKVTMKILKYATKYKVTLCINTMSDLCAHESYINLIKAGGHQVNMMMSSKVCDEQLERVLSPGGPSLKRRREAIAKLKQAGIEVYEVYKPIPETREVEKRTGMDIPTIKKLNNGENINVLNWGS